MRVLWICGLPRAVQDEALGGVNHGSIAAWSWITSHLPPPEEIELHIACLWPGGSKRKSFDYKGATVHLLPCIKRGRALLFFRLDTGFFRPLYDELQPDLVHGWGTEDSYSLVATALSPHRHVVGVQGLISAYRRRVKMSWRYTIAEYTERRTLARAEEVVVESAYSEQVSSPLCPKAELTVVEHPLRPEFLSAEPGSGEETRVLFLGNVTERKGCWAAMKAFAEAAPDNWAMEMIGGAGPAEKVRMREEVERLGLVGRFEHAEGLAAAELIPRMQQASVFLLPTLIDTGPTALKEALHLGLWPICYDNSGPGEYIRHFRFGSLAKDLNEADLTRILRRDLQEQRWKDPQRRVRLRQQTEQRFSPDTIWPQLRKVYERAVS